MATGSTVLHKDENGNAGNKRLSCPLHGCKRAYTDTSALESHIKEHEIPAQSLPGKVMLCSTVGCGGSFPNMQKLMEHMRHHHKPNIFFLCESCRTKLRSYRGLITHLHTCSKVSRGKPKSSEPPPPQPPAPATSSVNPSVMDLDPPPSAPQLSSQTGVTPSSVVQSGPPAFSTPFSSTLETSAPQLASHLQLRNETTNLLPSLNPDPPITSDHTDAQDQNQRQSTSTELVHPAPGSAPHSPPGSSAVWKRNQGLTHSRRILWEHTKGRYRCVQCGQTATNRKEMTQHINSYHSGNKTVEDTGSAATNT